MQEFQINEYITLKLEEGKTNIYINGKLFEQCKFLLLNIPVKEISDLNEIGSVDEAAENLSKDLERRVKLVKIWKEEYLFFGKKSISMGRKV
ncbi:MAG: hypothetical protein ACW96X_01180 [Promethearchaeota archaeon]|jgi:hypothetical protein